MRALRPEGSAPCVAAAAETLPFEDQSFDAAMAFSTVPHWQDPVAGLREMRRVARRVVVFTFDASEFAWRLRFGSPVTTCPRPPACRPGLAAAAGQRDRGPGGTGAHPVGLRRRLPRGILAPAEAYLEEHVRRACSVWTRVGPPLPRQPCLARMSGGAWPAAS